MWNWLIEMMMVRCGGLVGLGDCGDLVVVVRVVVVLMMLI